MHLRSLSLRNYRVYRELDLEFPDGLIGIYGPNGSGKSSLIESLRFGLYGDSRTDKGELRSADVREDLRVELTFEHEDNTYEVRRRLKGLNLTPEVEVFRNGQLAVQSAREATAFLTRVLGMDQRAFLASVCAQQKELTAFAGMAPAERRKLVLDLLGVSPVERALTRVREEARDARGRAAGARQALPDLGILAAEADAAAAEVAERHAAARQAADAAEAARVALEQARADVAAAETAAAALAQARRRAELARAEAERERRASAGHEERAQQADALRGQLQAAERDAGALQAAAAPLDELERARERQLERAAVARALEDARAREADRRAELAQATALAGDQAALAAARAAAEQALADADERLAGLRERRESIRQDLGAARARLDAAERAVEQGRALDPAAPCPTCGQPLGEGYAAVRQHRADELAAAGDAHRQVTAALAACEQDGRRLAERRAQLAADLERARQAQELAGRAAARVEAAEAALRQAMADVASRQARHDALGDPHFDPAAYQAARDAQAKLAKLLAHVHALRERVAQAATERALAKECLARADEADHHAAEADAAARAVGDADGALTAARAAEQAAADAATLAHGRQQAAAEALVGAERRREDRARALADATARHERVATLEEEAAYLARLADLVHGFRMHLVSRLGRRLSVEAAALFAELTDHEYQDLVVDPEDYSVRIADGGVEYELARFSGSENDLASLSLRVAVSLVIAESAGELGLLVLDEVLGSLDRERRERMLAALTALQGRFRQVLLVTHNEEVKDLLPAAIEVRKGPGRSATAALIG